MTVKFTATALAPSGTTELLPATWSDTVSPEIFPPALSRVSNIRVGVTVLSDDASPDAADTPIRPPLPSVTATAAPIAAHRDRIKLPELIAFPNTSIDATWRCAPGFGRLAQYSTMGKLLAENKRPSVEGRLLAYYLGVKSLGQISNCVLRFEKRN